MSQQFARVAFSDPDRAEYERRLSAVRAAMQADGFDAVVAGDSGDWLQPTGNARYLSNFGMGNLGATVPGVVVVVPLTGEPALVVPNGPNACWATWARQESWIAEVRSNVSGGYMPEKGLLADTVKVLVDHGFERGRIGVCGAFEPLAGLAAALPDAEVVAAEVKDGTGTPRDLIERVRRTKSEWEIERLRHAQRCVDIAVKTFMDNAQPGVRQSLCAAEADHAAARQGAEESLMIMNSGTAPWMWWYAQGNRTFAPDAIVSMEGNVRYDGYVAQLARSGVLGRTDDRRRRMLEVARESQHAMLARVRVGVTGEDVWNAGLEPIVRAGMTPWGRMGHGVGLSMDESFAIAPADDTVLAENDCMVIHASIYDSDTNDSLLLGEQYVLRAGGPEALSDTLPPLELAPRVAARAGQRFSKGSIMCD